MPFWSSDGRSLGYFTPGKLKRVPVEGGPSEGLANVENGRGGAWTRQGMILFAPNWSGPLYEIPESGGAAPKPVTSVGAEGNHRLPQFLSDGRHFLYYATGPGRIYSGDMGGVASHVVVDQVQSMGIVVNGHLLFVRESKLLAQHFDDAALRASSSPHPVSGAGAIAVSATVAGLAAITGGGTHLAYREGKGSPDRRLAVYDEKGKPLQSLEQSGMNPSVCPSDENRVLLHRDANDNIFLMDRSGRLPERQLTFHEAFDLEPIFSPDCSRMVFGSNRSGTMQIYQRSLGPAAEEERVFADSTHSMVPLGWSRQGVILFNEFTLENASDIGALDVNTMRRTPIAAGPYEPPSPIKVILNWQGR